MNGDCELTQWVRRKRIVEQRILSYFSVGIKFERYLVLLGLMNTLSVA